MSRSQFILGIALLVVSATLAFTISSNSEDTPDPITASSPKTQSKSTSSRPSYSQTSSSSGSSRHTDRTHYEVTVSDRSLTNIADIVQEDSRQELEALTERYNLTTSQRRGIFPHIAARHPQFQDGLIINGSSVPSQTTTSSLESAMYPLLNEEQQEDLENDVLADNQWWSEVISQLRDDLDQAISTGEMVPEEIDPVPTNGTPAPGDGEAVDNPDINLDDSSNSKQTR